MLKVKKEVKKEAKKKKLELNFESNCAISVLKKQNTMKVRSGRNVISFEGMLKISDMNNSANTCYLSAKATDTEIAKAVKKIVFK